MMHLCIISLSWHDLASLYTPVMSFLNSMLSCSELIPTDFSNKSIIESVSFLMVLICLDYCDHPNFCTLAFISQTKVAIPEVVSSGEFFHYYVPQTQTNFVNVVNDVFSFWLTCCHGKCWCSGGGSCIVTFRSGQMLHSHDDSSDLGHMSSNPFHHALNIWTGGVTTLCCDFVEIIVKAVLWKKRGKECYWKLVFGSYETP